MGRRAETSWPESGEEAIQSGRMPRGRGAGRGNRTFLGRLRKAVSNAEFEILFLLFAGVFYITFKYFLYVSFARWFGSTPCRVPPVSRRVNARVPIALTCFDLTYAARFLPSRTRQRLAENLRVHGGKQGRSARLQGHALGSKTSAKGGGRRSERECKYIDTTGIFCDDKTQDSLRPMSERLRSHLHLSSTLAYSPMPGGRYTSGS